MASKYDMTPMDALLYIGAALVSGVDGDSHGGDRQNRYVDLRKVKVTSLHSLRKEYFDK